MSRIRALLFVSLLALLLSQSTAFAQAVNASLGGVVHDQTGAALSGAHVLAVNPDTNASYDATTNASGEYMLLNLLPATYRLQVEAPGFSRYIQTGIKLDVGQNTKVDIALQVGEASNTVTVNADTTQIQLSGSTVSAVVNGDAIRNLPLNSRNTYSLLALTPGFAGSVGNNYNSVSYSINGSRQGYTDVLVDGIPGGFPTVNGNSGVGVFPSVDAINEYRIMGQNYPAEYGRSQGGVLNVAFKNGTNLFHGSLFEFARNSVFDANDFFSNRNKKQLPTFQRNQFGGLLTGPIVRDSTFFLLSTELLRSSSFISTTTTVPTDLQRQGDFSQTFDSSGRLVKIFDPFSTRANPNGSGYLRDQFSGNVIPQSRQSSAAQKILNYYPKANVTGNTLTGANNYFATNTEDVRIDSWDVRIDHKLPNTQSIFGRYSDRFYDDNPQPLFPQEISKAESRIEQRNWMRNLVVGYNIAPTPNTLYDVRLGFSRTLYDYLNAGLGFQASTLGFPSLLNTGGGLPIFPVFSASNYVQLGNGDNRHNAFMTYSLVQSLTWVHGQHTFKFGVDSRMIRVNDRETRDTSGNFSFTAGFTQGPNPSTASTAAGNSIASLLMGTPSSADLILNFKNAATQSYYFGAYVQDDWRLTPKLTLNLGLRYDLDTPRTERYNRMNYLDPTAASPLAAASGIANLHGGLVFVGANGHDRHQFNFDNNNVAPRIGLAYSPTEKTVFHAAYGIVFAPSAQAAAGTVGPFGFRVENDMVTSLDGITPYNTLDNPFPTGLQPATGSSLGLATGAGGLIEGFLRNTVTPYSEQYAFNMEHTLPGDASFHIGYAGNRGLQLQQSREGGIDFNQLPTSALSYGSKLNDLLPNPFYGVITSGTLSAAKVSRAQLLKPFPQFTSVLPLFLPGGQTKYDALQVRYDKRFSRSFQVNASYVFSKTYDNGTNHQDSYRPMADYAVASQHMPHRFVAGYVWQLPLGRGKMFGNNMSRGLDLLVGGWQLNGITTIQSGNPLQISASNVSGLGNPTEYANYDGSDPALSGDIHKRLSRYFKTSAFSQPAAFTLGNAPAYLSRLLSPGLDSTDFSIFKEFHAYREATLQFRAEAFNAFNHVQFGSPNTSVSSSSFGQITSQANSPRQLQFGAKLLF